MGVLSFFGCEISHFENVTRGFCVGLVPRFLKKSHFELIQSSLEQPIFIHYYLHHEMENNQLDYILHLYASRVYLVAEIWLEKIFLIFQIFSYCTNFFLDFFTFPRKQKKDPPIQVLLSKHHQKSSLFFIWKKMNLNMALYIQRSLGPPDSPYYGFVDRGRAVVVGPSPVNLSFNPCIIFQVSLKIFIEIK